VPSSQVERHIAGTTTRLILAHVRGRAGKPGVDAVLAAAGDPRPERVLLEESTWSSYDQVVALFQAAADVLDDPLVGHKIGARALAYGESSPLLPLLRSLGSPGQVLLNISVAAAKWQTVGVANAVEVDDDHALVTFQMRHGFVRQRLQCDYMIGLLTQIPVLFGLPPAEVRHDECQVDGAVRCLYRVSWRTGAGSQARIDHLEDRLLQVNEQVENLQSSAADLVSSDDVDTVLGRIAARAAAAVRAPRHLLVVQTADAAQPRVVAEGMTEDEAAALAEDVLTAGLRADPSRLVAEVASARRHYGRLAAIHTAAGGFFPEEERLLAVFARYAAAALDAATALEGARRGERTANLLLGLSRDLAAAGSAGAVCRCLADAVPVIAACDRGSVHLWSAERGELRLASAVGLGASEADAGAAPAVLRAAEVEALRRMVERPQPVLLRAGTAAPPIAGHMRALGVRTSAIVPLLARGRLLGVIAAGWAGDGPVDGLDPELVARLNGLADQGATALDNAQLLEQVRHQSLHDPLTGLPNSVLFADRLGQALAAIERDGGRLAVCFLDLDRFKAVNDTLGHAAGDDLLRQVADRLRATVRGIDTVARRAGDEFTVLVADADGPGPAVVVADKILDALRRPFRLGEVEVRVSPSIGIALAPDDGLDPDVLLHRADVAMYRAKAAGRDRWALFSPVLGASVQPQAG
jgi:diguanylate cyclase (GGDEF)-like protein